MPNVVGVMDHQTVTWPALGWHAADVPVVLQPFLQPRQTFVVGIEVVALLWAWGQQFVNHNRRSDFQPQIVSRVSHALP